MKDEPRGKNRKKDSFGKHSDYITQIPTSKSSTSNFGQHNNDAGGCCGCIVIIIIFILLLGVLKSCFS